ncbi:MAG TPA: succinylglutamate desuccinylase/aspartoacylase family protein [Planctomycetota bacterium]
MSRLPTQTLVELSTMVVNGAHAGPTIWLSAALHGDEINGVEIIRNVLEAIDPKDLRGRILAVPVVNVFGFLTGSRYLPDRRDLNRSFPGSNRGSLAGRLAHLFMTEIVARCSFGLDFHTAGAGRTNLPQVRGDLGHPKTRRLALAFRAPAALPATERDGSLREAASRIGIPVLLFEGGAPRRFDPETIQSGVTGTLRTLADLRMVKASRLPRTRETVLLESSKWLRAPRGGILRLHVKSGQHIERGAEVATIADVFGDDPVMVKAPSPGLVIGHTLDPLVNLGEAVVHLGKVASAPA